MPSAQDFDKKYVDKPSAAPSIAVASAPSSTLQYECPRLAACCSDPNPTAPFAYVCSGDLLHQGFNDCDKDVTAILGMYGDPTLNPGGKAKPPKGCTK